MATSEERLEVEEEKRQENRINLNPFRRLFGRLSEPPQKHIEPYVTNGQAIADLGCGPGHYMLALAESVGSKGRVYAVDFDEKAIDVHEMPFLEHLSRSSYRLI